jgi:DNA-nicking Smr family endonuclease
MGKKESSGFNTPFEGLKRINTKPVGAAKAPAPAKPQLAAAKPQPAAAKPQPAAAKPQPAPAKRVSTDDERSYEEAMRGATPLSGAAARGRRTSPLGAPPPPPAPRLRAPARNEDADADAELAELVSGSGGAPEADRRLVRRLRDGDYPIEARLDLHGHTRDEATGALERFVVQAVGAGRRCVLVIHGRGLNSGDSGPVLGEAVHRALAAGPVAKAILAFTHAGPAHGGDGATLVLLRKNKSRSSA